MLSMTTTQNIFLIEHGKLQFQFQENGQGGREVIGEEAEVGEEGLGRGRERGRSC